MCRKYLVCLLAVVLVMGCTDHTFEPQLSNTCSVQHPVQDLPWLRQMIEGYRQSPQKNWFIQQGTYKGQTVFAFNICCANCNYVIPVHNCSGERILNNIYVQGNADPLVNDLVTIAQAEGFTCAP